MAIRGDSYGSTAEVLALTRHLLAGESQFNSATRPTDTEVEKFIDRTSGILNTLLKGAGFTPSAVRANSTAKLVLDDFVTVRAAQFVELTQRGAGWSDDQNTRLGQLGAMTADAKSLVNDMKDGLQELGISQSGRPAYEGLAFTGDTRHGDRTDPDNTSREQPLFRRRQFSDTLGTNQTADEDND